MTETEFAAATKALIEARRRARPLAEVPPGWIPGDLAEAYRLQHAVAEGLGDVRGWKISALTVVQQQQIGVDCPVAGPLLAPWVQSSPARFALSGFVEPKLECEYAFELGRDLPPRAEPYTRAEVEEAMATLHLVIEIVDSRLPAGSPTNLQLGDALNNGAFIVGPAVSAWRDVAYATQPIVLRVNGAARAQGSGSAVLDGDPPGAVLLLANHPARGPRGLQRGDLVTTGSCTTPLPVSASCDVEADFGALGSVSLRLVRD
jgi:2-keto-4-pentenoate hydratase